MRTVTWENVKPKEECPEEDCKGTIRLQKGAPGMLPSKRCSLNNNHNTPITWPEYRELSAES